MLFIVLKLIITFLYFNLKLIHHFSIHKYFNIRIILLNKTFSFIGIDRRNKPYDWKYLNLWASKNLEHFNNEHNIKLNKKLKLIDYSEIYLLNYKTEKNCKRIKNLSLFDNSSSCALDCNQSISLSVSVIFPIIFLIQIYVIIDIPFKVIS